MMSQQLHAMTLQERKQEVHRVAKVLYDQAPDWVSFFREILGVGGVARRVFSNNADLAEFERSPEYGEIQLMLARLRRASDGRGEDSRAEPTRMITVRLPLSLHESLRTEAHDFQTSINKLCIAKLLQVLDRDLAGEEGLGDGNGQKKRAGGAEREE